MERVITPLRKSLVLRMTIALSAFLIIFLLVFAILIFNYFEKEFQETVSEQQNTLLTVVAQSIDHQLESNLKVIVDISRHLTPQIVNDRKKAELFLASRFGVSRIFTAGLDLISADGKIIACSHCQPGDRGLDLSGRSAIRQVIKTGRPLVTEPFVLSEQNSKPTIGFLAPVFDRNGKMYAMLGGRINLLENGFLGDLLNTRVARTGYLYIYSKDRTYIMHPDRSRILHQVQPEGVNRLFDEAIEGFEGTGRIVNSFGVDNLSTFKHLKQVDWILASNYPVAEAYEPMENMKKYFVFIVLAGALAMIAVVRVMMKRYSGMMVKFAEHVSRVAHEHGDKRFFQYDSDDEIGVLVRTFNQMIRVEDQRSKELLYASTHDGLTGLYNRAYFDAELERVSRGRVAPVSMVVADLDGLKRCNDTLGHAVGDEMLKAAAIVLTESFRAEDVVARIGGDEFAVIIPGLDGEAVHVVMERVCSLLAASPFKANGFTLSISFGWATSETPEGVAGALKQADKQMYLDKKRRSRARNGN